MWNNDGDPGVLYNYNGPMKQDKNFGILSEPDIIRDRKMSRKGRFAQMGRRQFTAEFKTKIVLEILREEKQIGDIAAEHGLSPNQLRNWKKEFLEK